jgi:hypothetical protein
MVTLNGYLFSSDGEPRLTLPEKDRIVINMIHGLLKNRGQYYANLSLRNIYEFYRLSLECDPAGITIHHPRLRLIFNNYMAIASRMFHSVNNYPVRRRVRTTIFMARFELNKSSSIYNRLSWAIRSLADLLYTYIFILVKSVTKKDYRRYLLVRLSDLKWYPHHLMVLQKRFSSQSMNR